LKADRQLDLQDIQTDILFVRILMSTGQWEAAYSILECLLSLFVQNKMLPGYAIEVLILHAIILKELGKPDQALHSLEIALNLAEPEGYVRIFVNEGSLMKDLLQAYSKSVGYSQKIYADKLLLAFASSPGNQIDSSSLLQPEPLFETLTEREREVLLLLADGLSNREIAGRLVLSEGTIKTHAHNLYSKLGVQSRTRAVARAKELNLLQ
jgi:LuxR family maltose regulon positive regulatory protein